MDTKSQTTPNQVVEKKEYITIRADYKLYKINFSQIRYIEGHSEYVKFYTQQKNIMAHYTLKKLESELPDNLFIRVHKSFIVSMDYVQEIESEFVVLEEKKIPIGNRYKEQLMRFIK
jgi:DNA-binding LytR/AlgR family response regulator